MTNPTIEQLKAEYSSFDSEDNSVMYRAASAGILARAFPEIVKALEESVKLQSHYAKLLNSYDGGRRISFPTVDDWIARLRTCAENAACNCPVAPSQDPVSPIWHLYYCDPETGRDHLSQSGAEEDIRKAFASAARRGADVWMIDPSGRKLLPSVDILMANRQDFQKEPGE